MSFKIDISENSLYHLRSMVNNESMNYFPEEATSYTLQKPQVIHSRATNACTVIED